jgi:formylglycine-generating enzyme required for sulfatase activity
MQPDLERPVAIKLLPLEISTDQAFADRFIREARTLARLNHPNIVGVYDFGRTPAGHLYFVMEYVEGTDLHRMIHGPGLTAAQALSIIIAVCEALQYAHGKGVVHRDIKPANVLVNTEGAVKVADFGLARPASPDADSGGLTVSGTVVGTPAYMAPEQTCGLPVDHRADIYSLGVMLYEMLCGEVPRGVFDPPSRRVQVDVRLDEVVLKAMQSQPERRYQNTVEMKTDVDAIRSGNAERGTRNGEPERRFPIAGKSGGSNPSAIGNRRSVLVAALLAVLAVAGWVAFGKRGAAKSGASVPPGGTRSVVSQTPAGEGGGKVGADGAAPSTVTPATATKDTPFVNTLGMKFVPVPVTGGPTDKKRVLFSVWHARVKDYEVFAKETKRGRRKVEFAQEHTHPVVNVDWDDAGAFCVWLTDRERAAGKIGANERYRLPSDHEWSCAVGIGEREDAAKLPAEKSGNFSNEFPWGTQWPPPAGAGNYAGEELRSVLAAGKFWMKTSPGVLDGYQDGFVNTSPVGSFPANRYGLYDIGGNVWQWCEDWFDKNQTRRTCRGASIADSPRNYLLSSSRHPLDPGWYGPNRGFRCVLELEPAPAKTAGESSPALQRAEAPATPALADGLMPTTTLPATAANPSAATKDAPFVNTLGMKFVPVRGTEALFCIWQTRVQDYTAFALVNKVDGSWAKQQFYDLPVGREPLEPVCGVNWEESRAFCQWLTQKETTEGKLPPGLAYRLPTDEEWSRAVGLDSEVGATPSDRNAKGRDIFPWGTEWPPKGRVGNYRDETFHAKYPSFSGKALLGYTDGFVGPSSVGSFPPNQFGIYDLGSNVREWCEDLFKPDDRRRVLRGVPWVAGFSDKGSLRATGRRGDDPSVRPDIYYVGSYGFRVVLASAPLPATLPAATKEKPFTNTLGLNFVPVLGTNVLFCTFETRVRDYTAFAAANKVNSNWKTLNLHGVAVSREPDHPASGVTWDEAKAFCDWLTKREIADGKLAPSLAYRLPTDDEWSRAVGLPREVLGSPKGRSKVNSTDFPWGKGYPPKEKVGNYRDKEYLEHFSRDPAKPNAAQPERLGGIEGYHDGYATTAPVGSFPANALGLFDMGGNASEWVEDLYESGSEERVARGSSWFFWERDICLSSWRHHASAKHPSNNVAHGDCHGFRLVLAAEPVGASK